MCSVMEGALAGEKRRKGKRGKKISAGLHNPSAEKPALGVLSESMESKSITNRILRGQSFADAMIDELVSILNDDREKRGCARNIEAHAALFRANNILQ